MTTRADAPLANWAFRGQLRTYQAEVCRQLPTGGTKPSMHIVAPPGSGKTLLGLILAAREGSRAIVLTPTVTIRQQWVQTAKELADDPTEVSDDPQRIGALTALTYQAVSVTGDSSPFDALARMRWVDELTESGRPESAAALWLAELAVQHPARYAAGIRKRASRVRRDLTRLGLTDLEHVLHPNARALIDRIVGAGVDTIVLDECHHLLDHWAIVVAYLTARIRAAGGRGLLIGLTATLPSVDDGREYENYTALLGDVDFEVPTPAVVKEGHLAPYRDYVWFTEPTADEASFIADAEAHLEHLVLRVLNSPEGTDYLVAQLRPRASQRLDDLQLCITQALSENFERARSAGAVLRTIAPQHPISSVLDPALFGRATSDDLLNTLARFSLDVLLPDPSADRQWKYVKAALADFGLHLTDRGLRRGRSPIEKTVAGSAAKDLAALEILHAELAGTSADRVRAVVVTDVVAAGNAQGHIQRAAPGARRVFDLLASDTVTTVLRPVLLTANHLRTTRAAAPTLARELSELLGTSVAVSDATGATAALHAAGVGTGKLVAAVSTLIARGDVRLLVSTRGLLGEGWDCPAVNTLIDLTTVATSTGTQQLRGRTLRLDPGWPGKVAHNWSVACLIPPEVDLDEPSELARLQRRHGHLLGLSADDNTTITSGLEHALDDGTRAELALVQSKAPEASLARLTSAARECVVDRDVTAAAWRVGEAYVAEERSALGVRVTDTSTLALALPTVLDWAQQAFLLGSGSAAAAGVVAFVLTPVSAPGELFALGIAGAGGIAVATRGLANLARQRGARRHPTRVYECAAIAIGRTLSDAHRIAAFNDDQVSATVTHNSPSSHELLLSIRGPQQDRRAIASAVEELFSPVRTPRFLLSTAPSRFKRTPQLLPVPQQIARRRADAKQFAAYWQDLIGPCELIELRGPEGLELLTRARSHTEHRSAGSITRPRTTLWG